MIKWFICQNEELVMGPFSTEDVENKLNTGDITKEWLIWGKPQVHWQTISLWLTELPELLKQVKPTKVEQQWHFVIADNSFGPMLRSELIETLKGIDNKADAYVWTKGMKGWTPLFECPDLMDDVGVSRRKHPRANITGSVVIKIAEQEFIGQLRMVSAGGCGITGIDILNIGQIVKISMKSDYFYKTFNAKAEVRYISQKGFIGLQFLAINMEEKAAIIDYVREQILRAPEQAA